MKPAENPVPQPSEKDEIRKGWILILGLVAIVGVVLLGIWHVDLMESWGQGLFITVILGLCLVIAICFSKGMGGSIAGPPIDTEKFLAEKLAMLKEKGGPATGEIVSLNELSVISDQSIHIIEVAVDIGEGKRANVRLKGSAVVLPRVGDILEILYNPDDLDVAMRVGEEPPENEV